MLFRQKIAHVFIYGLILIFPIMNHANEIYLGTDISPITFDQKEFDSTNVKSILAGYSFDKWSVEGSYNMSKTHNQLYGADQKINMYHLYSVYRSQNDFYYKVKLGITNESYKVYGHDGKLKFDDVHSGIARGLGAGYRFAQFNVEFEYSWLGQSLAMAGIGIQYNFN